MNHKCIKIFIALLVFVMPVSLYAQNAFKVTGRVYDAQTKEPIIGAGVMMKASNIGTITDLDGNYEMTVNDAKGILVVSAIGYKSVEMLISKRGVINFPLETDAESLEDAVVVGYGTQKKATITGSLTTANITDIAKSTARRYLTLLVVSFLVSLLVKQAENLVMTEQSFRSEAWVLG